jgi:HAD superfamily hydrolase (TIGR01509 family)
MGLRAILEASADFQYEIAGRKYTNLLEKEQKKREIQEGLIQACNVIDLIIEILRGSRDRAMAKRCLVSGETEGIRFRYDTSREMAAQLRFTEVQADAILDMRLYRLIGLEIEALMKRYMAEHYFNTILPKDHVAEALQTLKARGAQLAVLTASPHVLLDPCLKRNGLFDLFDRVWSCDDFNTSKADPDIYRRAAEEMGLAIDEVLFLDDNLGATSTAASAGMPVCGVYDDTSAEYEAQIRAVSTHYIYDFAALPQLQRTAL